MFNIFLNFKFNFFKKKKDKEIDSLYKASKEFNLSVLPISPTYKFKNLFPITNHVEIWSTFVIGSDKSYILCNIGDDVIKFNKADDIINTKGVDIPRELFQFLNNVWDITLEGKNLQFFIVLNSHLFIFNSYSLKDDTGVITGCVGFLRNFEDIKELPIK